MNRTILILICDFLLVSLLAFSTVDINKVAEEGSEVQARSVLATNQMDSGKDLTAVMRMALDEERKTRDALVKELDQTRENANQKQQQLSEREKQAQTMQQQLQSKDQETARLVQQQTALQQQYASAQTSVRTMTQQLQNSSTESSQAREKQAALEAEIHKQAEQAAALQQQLASLTKSNQTVLSEKERLAGQLQLAEVEKRHASEQAAKMQELVKLERDEKAKLAEGFKALATKSGELAQEMRDNRPLAPNVIFNEFSTNRVTAQLGAYRAGLFGSNKRREAETILVADGTNTFALCHVQDTPLLLWNPALDWDGMSGTLKRKAVQVPVRAMSFHAQDPRVVMIPVTSDEVRQLGSKVYKVSSDPYKFQDAVLVGAKEGYYGECKFQIDLTTPAYVKLDRDLLKGLFGKFNPTSGDLVFSKTGELLGIMANSTYCLMFRNFQTTATFQFSDKMQNQATGTVLTRLYTIVAAMPIKLQ